MCVIAYMADAYDITFDAQFQFHIAFVNSVDFAQPWDLNHYVFFRPPDLHLTFNEMSNAKDYLPDFESALTSMVSADYAFFRELFLREYKVLLQNDQLYVGRQRRLTEARLVISHSKTESDAESESILHSDAESDSERESDAESILHSDADSESETESDAQSMLDFVSLSDSETESEAESESKLDSESEIDTELASVLTNGEHSQRGCVFVAGAKRKRVSDRRGMKKRRQQRYRARETAAQRKRRLQCQKQLRANWTAKERDLRASTQRTRRGAGFGAQSRVQREEQLTLMEYYPHGNVREESVASQKNAQLCVRPLVHTNRKHDGKHVGRIAVFVTESQMRPKD